MTEASKGAGDLACESDIAVRARGLSDSDKLTELLVMADRAEQDRRTLHRENAALRGEVKEVRDQTTRATEALWKRHRALESEVQKWINRVVGGGTIAGVFVTALLGFLAAFHENLGAAIRLFFNGGR